MIELTPADIEEFRQLYHDEYAKELPFPEAEVMARELLNFYELVLHKHEKQYVRPTT